jgi:hypothetical protein
MLQFATVAILYDVPNIENGCNLIYFGSGDDLADRVASRFMGVIKNDEYTVITPCGREQHKRVIARLKNAFDTVKIKLGDKAELPEVDLTNKTVTPIDPKANFLQKLHQTAKEVEDRLLIQENKDVFLTKLKTFNDLESKFQSALTKAKEAAKADPDLRYYSDKEPEKSESQRYLSKKGWEVEQDYRPYLLEIWPDGFWRRPDEELPSGHEKKDRAIEKHWRDAEVKPRLRNYEKGPPKKNWVWENFSCKIPFWRPKLPFNPSGYLSKFSASSQVDSPPINEPPNTETRLVCEYALLAVIYDFALDVDTCDSLCGTEESWPYSLWQNLSSPLIPDDFNNLGKILSMINTAVKHVETDLTKLPAKKPFKYTNQVRWDEKNDDYYPNKNAIDNALQVGRNHDIDELKRLNYDRIRKLLHSHNCTVKFMSRTSPPRGRIHIKDWEEYLQTQIKQQQKIDDAVEKSVLKRIQ